ncbi:MAG: hypothetical protein H8E62_10150 [Planctomycetes bacterium]|nr:hypothetical protein [Planctomycetota bacterium]
MLTKEAFMQWFQHHIIGRWSTCAFTAVQLEDWYWRLKRYDTDTLTAAVRQHYCSDEPRRPSLKAIHAFARQQQANQAHTTTRDKESKGVPEAHTYIQCVAKDENGRGAVGWFVPILLWPFHREYTQAMYEQTAEQQRLMHQRSAGGAWRVVTHTTHTEMTRRRSKLTDEQKAIRRNV